MTVAKFILDVLQPEVIDDDKQVVSLSLVKRYAEPREFDVILTTIVTKWFLAARPPQTITNDAYNS